METGILIVAGIPRTGVQVHGRSVPVRSKIVGAGSRAVLNDGLRDDWSSEPRLKEAVPGTQGIYHHLRISHLKSQLQSDR